MQTEILVRLSNKIDDKIDDLDAKLQHFVDQLKAGKTDLVSLLGAKSMETRNAVMKESRSVQDGVVL